MENCGPHWTLYRSSYSKFKHTMLHHIEEETAIWSGHNLSVVQCETPGHAKDLSGGSKLLRQTQRVCQPEKLRIVCSCTDNNITALFKLSGGMPPIYPTTFNNFWEIQTRPQLRDCRIIGNNQRRYQHGNKRDIEHDMSRRQYSRSGLISLKTRCSSQNHMHQQRGSHACRADVNSGLIM